LGNAIEVRAGPGIAHLGHGTLRHGAEILNVLGMPTEPFGNQVDAPRVGSQ
jgi:hypothetical protein